MNTTQAGFVSAQAHHVGPSTQVRSLAWLAVAVALAVVAILVLGTMAEARWCGAELCVESSLY
jgi:hypothetical protein